MGSMKMPNRQMSPWTSNAYVQNSNNKQHMNTKTCVGGVQEPLAFAIYKLLRKKQPFMQKILNVKCFRISCPIFFLFCWVLVLVGRSRKLNNLN